MPIGEKDKALHKERLIADMSQLITTATGPKEQNRSDEAKQRSNAEAQQSKHIN